MTQAAQPARPDPDSDQPVVEEYEAYPFQVEEQISPSTALVPYTPPAADVPDEVEVRIRPGWRAYLYAALAAVWLVFAGVGMTGSISTSRPDAGVLVSFLIWGIAALIVVANVVRPSRVRIDGEGMVLKPRRFGVNRADVRIPWHSVTQLVLDTQMEGAGRSRRRVCTLRWKAARGVSFPGTKSTGNGWYALRLGDIDDDALAKDLERFRPPHLEVRDTASWFG